jgi:coenzyme F420-reducing hydrogenase delta subunit
MDGSFVLGCHNDKCWFSNRVGAFQRQFECQRMDGNFVLGCYNDKCWFANRVGGHSRGNLSAREWMGNLF